MQQQQNFEQIVQRLEALKQRPEAKALSGDIDQIVQQVRTLGQSEQPDAPGGSRGSSRESR